MAENEFDELVEGFEGDLSTLSDEEISKREEQFNKRVKKNIAILMSPKKFNATKRTQAAQWLGESGEPTVIPYLVKIYKGEKNSSVKNAAESSLGMLKALGNVLDDEDPEMRDMGLELVQNIVLKGQYGKRVNPPISTLRRLQFGLIGLAVVIFAIALILPEKTADPSLISAADSLTMTSALTTPSATATSDNPQILLDQFRDFYTQLDGDTRLLKTQLLTITREQPLDCTIAFSGSAQYVIPDLLSGITQLPDAVTAFNNAEAIIAPIRTQIQDSCTTQVPLERQSAIELSSQLVNAEKELTTVATILGNIGLNIPSTPTPVLVPTNTALPTETPTPTATIDPNLINGQLLTMESVLNEVNTLRGSNSLLLGYWQEAQNGSRGGCLQLPAPSIPADILVDNKALELVPDLQSIANTINAALLVTRNSWVTFETGCNTNTLDQLFAAQIVAVQTAQNGYTDAQDQIDALRTRLGLQR